MADEKTDDERDETEESPARSAAEPIEPKAEEPDAEEPVEPDWGPTWIPLAAAIAVPVLFFFVLPPLARAGLWDPHELNVADLARRLALNPPGAGNLAPEGPEQHPPGLHHLGRPPLPLPPNSPGL